MTNTTNPNPHTRVDVCDQPVFVIGAPRSATTVFARALAQHTRYWVSEETFILFDLHGNDRIEKSFHRWRGRPSSSWLRAQGVEWDEFLRHLGIGWNALFTSRSENRRWIDHTPHHALMAGTLARMFPGAKFFHLLRDGREVVDSMTHLDRTMTAEEREKMLASGFLPKWGLDFREACRTWARNVQAAWEFGRSFPARSYTVQVRQLRADPGRIFTEVQEFLGVDYELGPAAYCSETRINSSFTQRVGNRVVAVNRPTPWADWTGEQREIFRDEAGDTLVRTGFAVESELKLEVV